MRIFKKYEVDMDTLLIILIAIVFSALGQVALKNGMIHFGAVNDLSIQGVVAMFTNPYVFGGLCLYGLSTIFWLVALSQRDLSYVYPFVALTVCLVLVFSKFFFNEPIGPYRIAGILVIIGGLALLIHS